jgi:hypothetical protein
MRMLSDVPLNEVKPGARVISAIGNPGIIIVFLKKDHPPNENVFFIYWEYGKVSYIEHDLADKIEYIE